MRKVILHHHFFKNAGSTLMALLKRELGKGFVEYHPSGATEGRFDAENMAELLDKNPRLTACSSHHLTGHDFNRSPLLESKYKFFDFILIRHPFKRLLSMHSYYRGLPASDHPITNAAQSLSFPDFVRFLIEKYPNHMENPQVLALARMGGVVVPDNPLEVAKQRLASCALSGTVDSFSDAMIIGEQSLAAEFPGLKLHYKIVNASPVATGYDGTSDSIAKIVGSDLLRVMTDMCGLDIALCKAVEERLANRKTKIPNYAELEEDFYRRCRSLE